MVLASLLFAVVAAFGGGAPADDVPDIALSAVRSGDLPATPARLGDLTDGDTLLVDVTGFEPRSDATVVQCVWASGQRSCEVALNVALDGLGHARFLVRLRAAVAGIACSDAERSCVFAVVSGERRAVAVTAFGEPPPAPVEITAAPTRASRGESVVVTLAQLPRSTPASVALCSPGPIIPSCGPPLASFEADGEGGAQVTVRIGDGCVRGQVCGLVVVLDNDHDPVASMPFIVTGSTEASYDSTRLRAGLLVAALFAASALVLLRRTDWTPVEGDPFADVELAEDPFAT